MNIKVKIGLRIKQLRKDKKMTQCLVADISDMDRTQINHVENGKRNVSIETLSKICEGLGVTITEFFNNDLFINNKFFDNQ